MHAYIDLSAAVVYALIIFGDKTFYDCLKGLLSTVSCMKNKTCYTLLNQKISKLTLKDSTYAS